MNAIYTAEATAWGGRNGRAMSSDEVLDVQLSTPKELGGSGAGTNPEQLFAAGYAGCFHNALILVAKAAGESIEGSAVTAHVGLAKLPDGPGFGITAELAVEIPGMERAKAEALVAQAHQVCPYSYALRTGVDVPITIET